MPDDFDQDETPLRPTTVGERGTSARVQMLDPDAGPGVLIRAIDTGVRHLEAIASSSGRRVDAAEVSIGITRLMNGKIMVVVTGDLVAGG